MCEPTETAPGTGWRGWNTSDAVRPSKAAGDWIDLTHMGAHVDSPRHFFSNGPNARSCAGRRAELLFLPLNIVGGDGAPARVLERAIRD